MRTKEKAEGKLGSHQKTEACWRRTSLNETKRERESHHKGKKHQTNEREREREKKKKKKKKKNTIECA